MTPDPPVASRLLSTAPKRVTGVGWQAVGRRRRIGRVPTGTLDEQDVELREGRDANAATLRVRRITVALDQPTEGGDTEIHLLTDLPAAEAGAREAAEAYRTRWTIQGAFQTLTDVLRCEVETLGYPRAAASWRRS